MDTRYWGILLRNYSEKQVEVMVWGMWALFCFSSTLYCWHLSLSCPSHLCSPLQWTELPLESNPAACGWSGSSLPSPGTSLHPTYESGTPLAWQGFLHSANLLLKQEHFWLICQKEDRLCDIPPLVHLLYGLHTTSLSLARTRTLGRQTSCCCCQL